MALSPILVIGCGGSGGKVVLGLRRRLEEELRRRGWDQGIPAAWQLKWIDVPAINESHSAFGPPLPLGDYVPLAPFDNYRLIDSALVQSAGGSVDRLVGWRPTPNLELPVSKGAGQMRGVGRAVALANTSKVTGMVESAFAAMAGGEAQLSQLGRQLNAASEVSNTPTVFVVSSMAGGTGAGIFIDVCDVVRAMRPEVSKHIFGFLFTAEIFKGVGADGGMAPNTIASLSELVNGYLSVGRAAEPLYGGLGAVAATGKSGPSWPFVIGMQPMGGGAPLESPAQCYRAVTETILASMTNERFMQDFVNYQVTNFGPNSNAENRLTSYQMLNQSVEEGDQTQACGIVSSFGSAIVSVGSAKFGEWARDRLARSVLDHVLAGWKEYGRQLMGDEATAAVTDRDVVDFLVKRDRQDFISSCGLHEEDEPNGVEHNEVLEGILPLGELTALRDTFRGALLAELAKGQDNTATGWQAMIENLMAARQSSFRGDVEKALFEGTEQFAAEVVGKVGATVSDWLARFGVPVTQGLVKELREQCKTAAEQLRASIARDRPKTTQPTAAFVLAAFQPIGKNKCKGDTKFVADGVAQALGPQAWYSKVRREEFAIELLERVVQRVITPLQTQLEDVGGSLANEESTAERMAWPDGGGGVSETYRPSPTEKVLLPPDEWDAEYQRLLTLSAGAVNSARDQVAAGGFEFGPVVNPKRAEVMVSFDSTTRWWERDGGFVSVGISLRPDEVALRAEQWLWNENHAAGKFVRMGLEEYLSETGAQRSRRLQRFEEALTNARQLAQPLVRISPELMQRVHPGKDDLDVMVACEQFPFPAAMSEARAIVDRVLFGLTPPDGGWYMSGNTAGVESRLMTAVLNKAVQPSTVTSLTEPIAVRWDEIRRKPLDMRRDAIKGFWTYNRARLLTESIPLPAPSVRKIALGWFTGRLLGLVTDATETEGFKVHHHENGIDAAAALPWPLLNHRDQSELHMKSHQMQWLPSLLEHVGLAMTLLGHEPRALDGYEQLFRLGSRSSSVVESWVIDGVLPVKTGGKPQISGTTAEERKAAAETALDAMVGSYQTKHADTLVLGEWDRFLKIPYGFELYPLIIETLGAMRTHVASIETGQVYG